MYTIIVKEGRALNFARESLKLHENESLFFIP